jgi:hypothetical protein
MEALLDNFDTEIDLANCLVVHAVNKVMLSRSTIVFGKARSAGNGMPFPRSATQSKNDCAAALRERLWGGGAAVFFF